MSLRVRYFDIARGIAILCVMLSHTILQTGANNSLWNTIFAFCFSFHMPLFFILSGYFMHPERKFRWGKESREMLATYALTALAVVGVNWLHVVIRHPARASRIGMSWLKAALYGAGASDPRFLFWGSPIYIGAIWFLLALFWAHLLMYGLAKVRFTPVWVVLVAVVGYVSAQYVWLPLSVQSGMTATLFVYLGYLAKRYDVFGLLRRLPWLWIVLAVIWVVFIWKYDGFSVAMNQYGSRPLLAFVGSVCGTLCIVGISMLIDGFGRYWDGPARVLGFTGRYTLPLLCIHLFEIDVMPWGSIVSALSRLFGGHGVTVALFVVRVVFDALMACVLYRIPKVNLLFFPSLSKKRVGKHIIRNPKNV